MYEQRLSREYASLRQPGDGRASGRWYLDITSTQSSGQRTRPIVHEALLGFRLRDMYGDRKGFCVGVLGECTEKAG